MRAFVTGSTGCVGSNLIAALNRRGIEVIGLVRPGESTLALEGLDVTLVEGDILDIASLRRAIAGADWVFHAAAIAKDWVHTASQIYETNVRGTRNVLQAAWEAGVKRFVLTSSAAALGIPTPEKRLLDESCQFNLNPCDWVYGHSKQLAEQTLAEYVARGMHAVSVLPTAIMGPGDVNLITGQFIIRVLNGRILPFPKGGANFIDARDVAQAQITAAEYGRPGERYVLGGHNMPHTKYLNSIGQALGMRARIVRVPHWILPAAARIITVLHKMGRHPPVERGRVLISGQFMYYNNRKAVRELGLTVRPFEETVRDAYRWYADHGLLEGR